MYTFDYSFLVTTKVVDCKSIGEKNLGDGVCVCVCVEFGVLVVQCVLIKRVVNVCQAERKERESDCVTNSLVNRPKTGERERERENWNQL